MRITIVFAGLLLSGCMGTFSPFGKKADTSVVIDNNATISMSQPARMDRQALAKNVADIARKCWVKGDDTYQVIGPAAESSDFKVSLVYAGDTPALDIFVGQEKTQGEGYEIVANGPLAIDAYETRILDDIHRAAMGMTNCHNES